MLVHLYVENGLGSVREAQTGAEAKTKKQRNSVCQRDKVVEAQPVVFACLSFIQ